MGSGSALEALCDDVLYKTHLLHIRNCSEMKAGRQFYGTQSIINLTALWFENAIEVSIFCRFAAIMLSSQYV